MDVNQERVADFNRDMWFRAGGALTIHQAAGVLGSMEAVNEAVAARELLCVEDDGANLYPAFQFQDSGVAPGMGEVLKATPNTSPWELLQFFVAGDEGLGSDSPMELIKGSLEDIERAVRFARVGEV